MNMETKEIIQTLQEERQLTQSTIETYTAAIKHYETINDMTLQELLDEAEDEEEQGLRWKHRTLRKRLTTYQNWLLQNYNYTTAKLYLNKIKTIYRHNIIEIHELPIMNKKQAHINQPLTYNDLPSKETLLKAYNHSNPLMRAYILFAISSGCSRTETLNLTIDDFKEWTKPYTIDQILNEKIDIIPTIRVWRQKTNKHYYTYCTPEAIREITNYLTTRDDQDPRLFNINKQYIYHKFRKLNNELGLGTINNRIILRTHTLRKYHATHLHQGENALTLDEIDTLQGRSKNMIRDSYYYTDPEELKKKYIQNIDQVTLLDQVNKVTVESPEVIELREKAKKIDELEKIVNQILKKNDRI